MGRQGLFASVGVSCLLTGSPVISGASRHTGRRKSSMDAPPTVHLRCADGKVVQPMPRVCIYCGQHASETRKESFSWKAAWGVFVDWWVSGPSLGTRRFTIEIPVCKKHSKVIGRAKTLDWVALACFLIGLATVLIVDTFGSRLFEFAPGIPWTILVLWVPWGVALILLVAAGLTRSSAGHTPLQVESIDETGMTLGGVSSEFRDAVMQAEVQQTTVSDPS